MSAVDQDARKIPRWLTAVILILPAIITGIVVIANRPGRDISTGSASTTGYYIRAQLLPVRTGVLDHVITSTAELPTPEDCDALLAWAAEQGPAAVNVGRVSLALTANRLLQVKVDEVSVAVAERRTPTAKTFIQCDTSDWRKRWEPIPGDQRFGESYAVHGDDYFTETPVVTLDRSAGPVFPVEYYAPDEHLTDKVMTVAAGERVRLPFYVVRSGANVSDADLVVLTVAVSLTINGRPSRHELTVTMHHFHEQTPETVRYEWLTDERRWVKDRHFDPDRAAPAPRGGSYLCEVFTDADLAEPLGEVTEVGVVTHGECAWSGRQDTRVDLSFERHPDEQAAREDYHRNLTAIDGVTNTPLASIGDEATLRSSGLLLARRGRDTLFLSLNVGRYQSADGVILERLARIAATRLWKAS